ncbi:MAG TPA: endonuclease/exonuclease/phosphatase family protein [Planctomycetota bacterium]|nr:endonuclease/exonuclease/phosphatase family protein [Planctomycetota bacterium]
MIRILSHNAFWFQGYPFDGDQPGLADAGVLAEMTALYRRIGADIVCLQEIQSPEVAQAVGSALGRPALYEAGGVLAQYGGCVVGANVTAEAVAAETAAVQPPHRIWQRVRWTGPAAGLAIVNVHAPSDRQLGSASGERRLAEFQARLNLAPQPDILCGDFNERPGRAVGRLMAAAGYVDAAEATHNDDRCTSIGGKRSDFIWVTTALAGRLVGYDVVKPRDFLSRAAGKEFRSDHLPLWIDLAIGAGS